MVGNESTERGNVQRQRAGPLHCRPGAQRSSSGSDQLEMDQLGPLQTDTAMAAAWEEPLGAKRVLLKEHCFCY